MSNSQQPHGLQPTRLLRPWDFPGKSTGVECHCLLLFNFYSLIPSLGPVVLYLSETTACYELLRIPGCIQQANSNYNTIPTKLSQWLDFPGGSDGKASVYNVGDLGSIPGSGRYLEKEMATHSSTIAWKIPRTEEPGRLQLMGLRRVGHN